MKNSKPKINREQARKIGRKLPQPSKDLIEPTLSENAAYIAKTRYSFRDDKGEPIESPKQMFWRIAHYIAAADRLYHDDKVHHSTAEEFYKIMATQKFIPNTPTLVNSGKSGQSLSACFVLPVEDDMESILKTMSDMAMIHKMGGGTGFSFSKLRPREDIIGTSKGKSTGPVAFLQAYNDVTSQIRQGGVRRGANMGIIHYTHPDVLRFAVHKVDEFSLTNFNISVTVDEKFMKQITKDEKFVQNDEQFDMSFESVVEEIKEAYQIRDLDLKNVRIEAGVIKLYDLCAATNPNEGFELINPRTKQVAGKLNAKKFFNLLTRLAWQYGDPGMILIDRVNNSRANPTPKLGQIEATNPCAEQPLLPYDACTLGSINLSKFVNEQISPDSSFNVLTEQGIDWNSLKQTIHSAIHFLDNVLDLNQYPVDKIDEMTRKIRRVGLGVMGWADLLVKLGIGYNTKEAYDLAEKIMSFIQKESDSASIDLAKIRGVFPAFKGSIYDKKNGMRLRNGARTTIAPTGTISLLADCSSGIEPHFALTYAKNTIEGKRLFTTNQYFLEALHSENLENEDLLSQVEQNKGSVQGLEDIPQKLKKVFVVAGDIAPKDHVRMAAAFQKFTDNGISKTINFSNEATVEDVRQAYFLSYELGCNMITIYRDGSRVKQVLEVKKGNSYYDQLTGKKIEEEDTQLPHIPRKKPTPHEAWGMRVRKKADVGHVYTSVFRDADGSPVEVFVTIGKTGGYVAGAAEVTGRLASRALKYGASLEEVATDLVGISCGTPYGLGQNSVLSAFDAVGKSLLEIARAKQLQLPVGQDQTETSEEKIEISQSLSSGSNGSNGHSLSSNGKTNGYTNGYTNGHSNGYTNGYTNGNGKTHLLNLQSTPTAQPTLAIHQPQGDLENQTTLLVSDHLKNLLGEVETKFNNCPDCGSPLTYQEGCKKCVNPTCGWSKCS